MRASERPCHAVNDNRFTKRVMKSRRLMGLNLQACLPAKPLSERTLPPEMHSVNRPEVSRRSDVGLRANRQTRRGLRAAVKGLIRCGGACGLCGSLIGGPSPARVASCSDFKTGPKARGRRPRGADANTRKQWRRAVDHSGQSNQCRSICNTRAKIENTTEAAGCCWVHGNNLAQIK
jgi:hypothetical protein